MRESTILIVEDSQAQRLGLQQLLRFRGFKVESAGDVKTARTLVHQYANSLSVLVLDMNLEDSEFPHMTGADLGLELKNIKSTYPPEFLIASAYSAVDYYKLSLSLGAAAYLHKGETAVSELVCHIRALTLRHALKSEEVSEHMQRLSIESKNETDVVARFCREVLKERFQYALGAPFIFLLTSDGQTQCCVGSGIFPEGFNPAYDKVQAIAFGEVRNIQPVTLNTSDIRRGNDHNEVLILDKLDGACFLPFSVFDGVRFSVGFLKDETNPLAEDVQTMARVLTQYVKNEVIEPLISIILRWRVEETKREEMLRSVSSLFFYMAHDLLATLQQYNDPNGQENFPVFFDQLKSLATRLREEGMILASLTGKALEPMPLPEPVSIANFIREIVFDLDIPLLSEAIAIDGDCALRATREDLLIVTSRLLRWFAERLDENGAVLIRCVESDTITELVFEDRSTRLMSPLRQRLFFPFSESGIQDSLYLVKMLVEMKYFGTLIDQTDTMLGEIGHRFVISVSNVKT